MNEQEKIKYTIVDLPTNKELKKRSPSVWAVIVEKAASNIGKAVRVEIPEDKRAVQLIRGSLFNAGGRAGLRGRMHTYTRKDEGALIVWVDPPKKRGTDGA
jgi:hypothetical protein